MLEFEKNLKPNDYWRTPNYITDAVNELWPDGWMDPCPANPKIDGMSYNWCQPAYINPPFSNYLKWAEWGQYHCTNEQLYICGHDHSTKWFKTITQSASALCLLSKRVRFIDPVTGLEGKAPSQCHTLIYCHGINKDNTERFEQVFSKLGIIVKC